MKFKMKSGINESLVSSPEDTPISPVVTSFKQRECSSWSLSVTSAAVSSRVFARGETRMLQLAVKASFSCRS